ncbi:unnamed protein product [Cylicostephanus goldi]|uniref:Uncharacterized protein n=1 Tax=Cylicostephanus goldi TaxID=71465 RepID=A0A3P6RCE2_CYLGO|nr:unnamed protein product [Cylicostephanus goldi]
MLSKKTVKRRISFSDDLVSVRHFEVDVYQEDQVVPLAVPPAVPPAVLPVVPRAMPTEQCQIRSERTRITSETGSSHVVSTVERRDPVRDDVFAQQRQLPHPPVVKQEPIDEDDDVVVLFSGKTEVIAFNYVKFKGVVNLSC